MDFYFLIFFLHVLVTELSEPKIPERKQLHCLGFVVWVFFSVGGGGGFF